MQENIREMLRSFQILCKLKTDIRYVMSYLGQNRFFEVLPLLVTVGNTMLNSPIREFIKLIVNCTVSYKKPIKM